MDKDSKYIGNELELFSHAVNWKRYWGKKVIPFLGKQVLEVGAGMGTNTSFFLENGNEISKWVCLEPDARLAEQIHEKIPEEHRGKVEVSTRYLKEYNKKEEFDAILYIDVIEHIKEDQAELEVAKSFLKKGGHLIILVPAHNYLYSNFDKEIGHFRRYNKARLKKAVGEGLSLEKLWYLDSVGTTASVFNKLFLKQSYPTVEQIKFWDRNLVTLSKVSDPLFGYHLGKSLLGVWKK